MILSPAQYTAQLSALLSRRAALSPFTPEWQTVEKEISRVKRAVIAFL